MVNYTMNLEKLFLKELKNFIDGELGPFFLFFRLKLSRSYNPNNKGASPSN